MATFILTDVTTYIAGHDFTTDSNELSVSVEVEDQEKTCFGDGGWRSRLGGFRTVEAELSGYWQSDISAAVDPQTFNALGSRDEVVTVSPTGAAGSPAYMFQAGRFSYELFGDAGEVAPWSVSMQGTNGVGLVRGKLARPRGPVAAPGVLGAVTGLSASGEVGAGQYLYAAVHVFAAGSSMTLTLESDDAAGFASPTTRATIGPLTGAGGTWVTRIAGPITDTHYRINATAVTGTFQAAAAIGIAYA